MAIQHDAKCHALFIGYLGRPPSSTELAYWSAQLAANSNGPFVSGLVAHLQTQASFVTDLAKTTEQLVNDLFVRLTGTSPDMALFTHFVNGVRSGMYDAESLPVAILRDCGIMPRSDGAGGLTYGAPDNAPAEKSAVAIATASGLDLVGGVENKVTVSTAFTAELDTAEENIAYATSSSAGSGLIAAVSSDDTAAATAAASVATVVDEMVLTGQSYALAAAATSVNEGATATFTLTTANVANGTQVPYTLSGVSASDVVGGSLTGTATVGADGTATITVALAGDYATEGAETLTVALDNGSATASVTVNDTSLDPVYTVAAGAASANEGDTVTFTVTADSAVNADVAVSISGIAAADVTGDIPTTVTLVNGTGTISLVLASDATTEGAETISVTVGSSTATTAVGDTSITPVFTADDVAGTIVNGQGTAIMTPTDIAAFAADDLDSAGAMPTGAVAIDMSSATGGQLVTLDNGNTMFVADSGVRQGSFEYTVAGVTGTGTVNVTLNTAPVFAGTATLAATEDTAATGNAAFTDADSDTLTYTYSATSGTVVDNGSGSFSYTGNSNFNGTDTVTVSVNDGYTTVTQDIAVTVAAVDDNPQAVSPAPATLDVVGGTVLTIDLNDYATDPEGGALVFTPDAASANGGAIVDNGDGTVTYTSAAATGADSFSFTVSDGNATASATVTLNVTDNAPTAAADSFGTGSGNTVVDTNGTSVEKVVSGQVYMLDVLANDDDGEASAAQTLTINSVTQPVEGGLVEIVNNTVRFNSTPGYAGNVTFSYTMTDGFGSTSTATVTTAVEAQLGGTTGNDLLVGTPSTETLEGGAGNDTIDGGSGADRVDAGADNDTVTARGPESNINGGTGVDTLVIAATNNNLTDVDLSNGADQTTGDTATVTAFENLDASAIAQNLDVTDSTVTTSIKTGSGVDAITLTNSGAILVDAGAANDTININPNNLTSADSLAGGSGTDTLAFSATAISVADAQFTNVTTLETLKLSDSDQAQNVTLGVEAEQAGIVTVDLTSVTPTAAQTVTVNASAYAASGITINVGEANAAASVNSVLTGGAGNDVFYFDTDDIINTLAATAGAGTVDATITGGGGTDSIVFDNDASGDQIGNAVQINVGVNVATLEQVVIQDSAVDNAAGDATVSFDAGYAQTTTLTIDGSQLDAGETLLVNADANASNEAISVLGGAGDDTITANTDANNTISGGAGIDTITVRNGANSISGDAGNDLITIGTGANTVLGGDGDDQVTVVGGNQNLSGDAGNDSFTIDEDNLDSNDTITGGDGTDSIIFIDGDADTIVDSQFTNATTLENITLNTNAFTSAVTLGAEALQAGVVTVTAAATAQNDVITLHNGGVQVINASGNDNITGGTGNDSVVATTTQWDSNDSFTGGTGTDIIYADNGAGAGAAVTIGLGATLTGVEQIAVQDDSTDANGDVTVTFDAGYVLTTLTIDGSALDASEVLTVTATNNVAAENLVITGGAADDVFSMGAGSADSINGAAGSDTVSFATANLTSGDTIDGGAGTDAISITDVADSVDSDFTNASNVEMLILSSAGAASNTVTLGAEAQAAGIVTVDGRLSTTGNNINASAYTVGITMFANDGGVGSGDTLVGGTGNDTFTVDLDANHITTNDTLTGNAGTDTVSLANTADTLNAFGAGVTGVEQIVVSDATTGTDGDVTISFDAGYTQTTITIDASAADTGETVRVDASANAAAEGIVLQAGAGSDTVLLGAGSDNVSMNAGNDGISMTIANLSSADTIDGGAGTDTLTFTGAAANITDDLFTNVTTLETVVLTSVAAGATVGYVFGAQAQEAGITTITGGDSAAVAGKVTIDASAMTAGLTINLTADGGNNVYVVAGGSGNDVITMGNTSTAESGFVQGGAGADTIIVGAGVADNTQIRVNLTNDIASGTTLASADQVTGFTDGAGTDTDGDGIGADMLDPSEDDDGVDVIEFVGTTLSSGGGGLNPLSTTTDNFTLASDLYKATTLAELATFATGSVSSAYVILVDDALSDATVTNTVAGATGQTGIGQAVTFLTSNGIAATAVANTKVLIGIEENGGANMAFFLYDEGATADAGIQSSELTLVGVYDVSVDSFHIDNLM